MSRALPRGVIAIALVAVAYASIIQSFNWNQTSHYALVRSIGRGTPHIDRYIDTTHDRAAFHGHWYSSRAPGLAFFLVPEYKVLSAVGARAVARWSQAQRSDDEMVWAIGLFGAVLPALVIMLLVRSLAERVEPGYGTAAAVTLGLGTLLFPVGTLLFSHVFAACLGFVAFALLWRERDGPPRLWIPAVAGLAIGYAITTEYALAFVAVILAVYAVTRPGHLSLRARTLRLAAYAGGALAGLVPLALYDLWAFGSVTHVAYADLPRHQSGFFGITTPSLRTAAALLFSSHGLLTLAPVLALAALGVVLLYRRGNRAEATVTAGICLAYLLYNSGYYLPFGGAAPGPRFLIAMLPFLGVPLALAYRRWPGPVLALGAASIVTLGLATLTHPLVGSEAETAVWTRLATHRLFQPTVLSAFGLGRGLLVVTLPVAAAGAGLAVALAATPALRLSPRALAAGAAVATGWAVAATLLPKQLGIDALSRARVVAAGDPFGGSQYPSQAHPLLHLCAGALAASLAALVAVHLVRGRRGPLAARATA